jgi:hypothetical protein
VDVPTVTEMGPVVAPAGTVATRVVLVAETTVAGVPLNFTVLELGVALNPWPWMVTVCPAPACAGLKLKMASVPLEVVERVMDKRLPTASYE